MKSPLAVTKAQTGGRIGKLGYISRAGHRSVEVIVETDVSVMVIVFVTVLAPAVTRRLAETNTPAESMAEAITR